MPTSIKTEKIVIKIQSAGFAASWWSYDNSVNLRKRGAVS